MRDGSLVPQLSFSYVSSDVARSSAVVLLTRPSSPLPARRNSPVLTSRGVTEYHTPSGEYDSVREDVVVSVVGDVEDEEVMLFLARWSKYKTDSARHVARAVMSHDL